MSVTHTDMPSKPEISHCRRAGWHLWHTTLSRIGWLFLAALLGNATFGQIEGRLFPTTSDFTIHEVIEHQGATGPFVEIHGSFDILRAECHDATIEWAVVSQGQTTTFLIDVTNDLKSREAGPTNYGPWYAPISADQLENSRIEVIQDCPWRPWPVKTYLWP